MTLPPLDSQHYELRRRIVNCRERLRRKRSSAQKAIQRGAPVKSEPQKKEAQRKN